MAMSDKEIIQLHDMDMALGQGRRDCAAVVDDLQVCLQALSKGKTVIVEERLSYAIEVLQKTISKLTI